MGGWADFFDEPEMLKLQLAWDRRRKALRMRECGLTFAQIGARLGVSVPRVRQLIARHQTLLAKVHRSPVEQYMGQEPFAPMKKKPNNLAYHD